MNKKLTKYSLKYSYLKLEQEDIEDEFNKFKIDFDKIFGKYFGKPKDKWINEETGEITESIHKPVDSPNDSTNDSTNDIYKNSKDIKKLYNELSIKTHPDKGGKKAHFQRISKAYKDGFIIELIYFAQRYDCNIDLNYLDEKLVINNIEEIEKKQVLIKNSLVWQWSKGNLDMKSSIVKQIEDLTGCEIMDKVIEYL